MKPLKIVVILIICAILSAFINQDGNIDKEKLLKILKIYETSIQAYIDEVVNKEYPNSSDTELIRSRSQVLLSNVKLIDKSVLDSFEKIKENKKEIYVKLIDNEYRNYFPGLEPSLLNEIHKKVDISIKD